MTRREDIAISVKDLHKSFKLPIEQHSGIKQNIINILKGGGTKGYEIQHVLKGLDFEINKGDFFGIVGRNGSGKSTLLKTLAGIYTPDQGQVTVDGTLVPFIELGVGFNPELTGRENVFLNGALLGFSHDEMRAMYDDIVEFAEIEKFMDQKLKNYSSGMQVRLAFSIAIRAGGDILLLDEVLAVGDEAFQRKCEDFFNRIKKDKSKTVILVTHGMDAVRKYCNKAILIDKGVIKVNGSADDVASQYSLDNYGVDTKQSSETGYSPGLSDLVPLFKINPISKQVLGSDDSFEFEVIYKVTDDIPVRFGFSLIDESSGGSASVIDDGVVDKFNQRIITSSKKGTHRFRYKLPLDRFNSRKFYVTATLFKDEGDSVDTIAFTSEDNICHFTVKSDLKDGGLLKDKGAWI